MVTVSSLHGSLMLLALMVLVSLTGCVSPSQRRLSKVLTDPDFTAAVTIPADPIADAVAEIANLPVEEEADSAEPGLMGEVAAAPSRAALEEARDQLVAAMQEREYQSYLEGRLKTVFANLPGANIKEVVLKPAIEGRASSETLASSIDAPGVLMLVPQIEIVNAFSELRMTLNAEIFTQSGMGMESIFVERYRTQVPLVNNPQSPIENLQFLAEQGGYKRAIERALFNLSNMLGRDLENASNQAVRNITSP